MTAAAIIFRARSRGGGGVFVGFSLCHLPASVGVWIKAFQARCRLCAERRWMFSALYTCYFQHDFERKLCLVDCFFSVPKGIAIITNRLGGKEKFYLYLIEHCELIAMLCDIDGSCFIFNPVSL